MLLWLNDGKTLTKNMVVAKNEQSESLRALAVNEYQTYDYEGNKRINKTVPMEKGMRMQDVRELIGGKTLIEKVATLSLYPPNYSEKQKTIPTGYDLVLSRMMVWQAKTLAFAYENPIYFQVFIEANPQIIQFTNIVDELDTVSTCSYSIEELEELEKFLELHYGEDKEGLQNDPCYRLVRTQSLGTNNSQIMTLAKRYPKVI